MKKYLLTAFVLLLGLGAKAQTYAPITLTGFTDDVVANGSGSAMASTTNDVDGVQFTFMAQNFVNPSGQSPATALPNSGTITSAVASTPGLTFQLAPYNGHNALRISGTGSGTLTFGTPRLADQIFILATSGSGASTAAITVTFTDATTQVFTQSIGDWYNGANFAIQGISRVNRSNNVIENSAANPRLYQYLLTLSAANTSKSIQSITFNKTSSAGVLNVMAVTIRALASSIANDAGVTAIVSPVSGCGLSNQETVTVTITNFGSAAQSNIPVSYSINGGTAVNEVFAGPLASNATANYTFAAKADLGTNGAYNFVAATSLGNDGLTSNDSFSRTVTVASAPGAPTLSATGSTSICPGSFATITASSATPGASYQWLLNGNPISGASSANFAASAAGNYSAIVNSNGCLSPASAPITITLNAAPAVPSVTASGPATFCTGNSVTFTAASATAGATYSWLLNGSTINGATAATYTATSPGNYSVMAFANGCNSAASSATTVTVNQTPATPAISQHGQVLSSGSGVGNQWHLNGNAIPGATGQYFTPTASGAYTVVVTNSGCSSPASNTINFAITGIKQESEILHIDVYPNPSSGLFRIILPEGNNYHLEITDLTGRVIRQYTVRENALQIDLNKEPRGLYILRIKSEKGSATKKILVN